MRRVIPILMVLGFLQALALIGCKQPCCMLGDDSTSGHAPPLDVASCGPDAVAARATEITSVSTVLHPEGATRPISLEECIALGLENGRVGGTALRVLSYDPAIVQTDIETALSRFDATWRTSFTYNEINERTGSALQNILTGGQETTNVNSATFETGVDKPLPTGGTAGVTFRTDYLQSNEDQVFNPEYQPRVILSLEQPLLQGFGVRVNHLGILIARIGSDQAHDQFAARVQDMLFDVERAYWDCYESYWNLYSIDNTVGESLTAWQKAKAGFESGQVRIQNLAQLEQQYQSLRLLRLTAVTAVLESERQLRLTVGLPPEDGTRLVPSDTPTVTGYLPDWQTSVNEALASRPELLAARQDIARLQLQIEAAKNQTLPDLRFVGNVDTNGTGGRLFGHPNNAFEDLGSFRFHDWTAGLQLNVPIGMRAAYTNLKRQQLILAQRTAALHDQETLAIFSLQRSYRNLLAISEGMRINGALLKAANVQYQSLRAEFDAGAEKNPSFYLAAQNTLLGVVRQERATIYQYNIALAEFEREKGALLKHDNIAVAEGPLPGCAQDRASAHIRERQEAHVIRERKEAGMACSGEMVAPIAGDVETPPVLANAVDAKTLTTSQPDAISLSRPTAPSTAVKPLPTVTAPGPLPSTPYAPSRLPPTGTYPVLPPPAAGLEGISGQHP